MKMQLSRSNEEEEIYFNKSHEMRMVSSNVKREGVESAKNQI